MKNNDIYTTIIENDLLSDAFKYIVIYNSANLAPYHNTDHMMAVTQKLHEGYLETGGCEYYNLILAGMFHDMNHSMGEKDDSDNVKMAIKSLKDWWKSSGNKIDHSFMDINIDECIEIIKATQYPYVIDDVDLTIPQKLIRDSDLLIMLRDNWFNNILGLDKELNIDNIPMTLKGSLDFYNSIEFRTEWAKEIGENQWEEFKERFQKYVKLFNQ